MEQLTFTQQLQQFISAHPVLVAAWVVVFVAVLFSLYKGLTSKFKVVNNAQATELVNRDNAVFLDIRSDEEFRNGHIAESHSIHPSDIKSGKINAIEKFKTQPVIVVDGNGFNANSSAEQLAKLGFAKVYVLKEGLLGWRSANLPTVKK